MSRKARDITGRRFGKLEVLYMTEKRKRRSVIWVARCDCGNVIETSARYLLLQGKDSCGCDDLHKPKFTDDEMIGRRFGRLTVLSPFEPTNDGRVSQRWLCKCDCGVEKVFFRSSLLQGHASSCGCFFRERYVNGTDVLALNNKVAKNNTSGYTGVFQTKYGKWAAQIYFKRKCYRLGHYDRIEDAAAAYQYAKAQYHDKFLDWYYKNYPGEVQKNKEQTVEKPVENGEDDN